MIFNNANSMNIQIQRSKLYLCSCLGLCAAAILLASCSTTSPSQPKTLKDTYKKDFYVGVAINRTIATGGSVRADNVNRNQEQVDKDITLVKAQFNQISPENDLK